MLRGVSFKVLLMKTVVYWMVGFLEFKPNLSGAKGFVNLGNFCVQVGRNQTSPVEFVEIIGIICLKNIDQLCSGLPDYM